MKNFALKHALLVVLSFEGKKSVVTLLCVCVRESLSMKVKVGMI